MNAEEVALLGEDGRVATRRRLLAPFLTAQDKLFAYDGLYQVTDRERGVLDIDQTRENNVSNQITEIDSASAGVSYDLNGNMLLAPTSESLEGPSRQLVWDAWNRLRLVKDHENNVLGEYQYDGQTRRTTSESGGVVRHFYYNDQWRSVEERLDAASTAESQYIWNPADRWELILRDRSTENNGTLDERLYSLKDQLDPVAVCDDEGEVVERYAYSAFGLTTMLDPEFEPLVASTVAWSFLFHGEFRDGETGWYNYGYRYYGAELGRWLSRDPMGETGSNNLYSAPHNDLLNEVDYFGACPSCRVYQFGITIVGWQLKKAVSYTFGLGHMVISLSVRFDAEVADRKDCLVDQQILGDGGGWSTSTTWVNDPPSGGLWWDGTTWNYGTTDYPTKQSPYWRASGSSTEVGKFYDNPGLQDAGLGKVTLPYWWAANTSGAGFFRFKTRIRDKGTGATVRELEWRMRIHCPVGAKNPSADCVHLFTI